MKIIRKNTFETNSSSTHSLVITPIKEFEQLYWLDFYTPTYMFNRREFDNIEDCFNKIRFIIASHYLCDEISRAKLIKKLKSSTLRAFNYYVESSKDIQEEEYVNGCLNDIDKFFENVADEELYGEINMPDDLLDRFLNDEKYFAAFLFNKESYIVLGGDEYRGHYIRTIGHQFDYKSNYLRMLKNGEPVPEDWFDEDGVVKKEYSVEYWANMRYVPEGEFWDKLKEYRKEHDVYFVGTESGDY